MSGCCHPGAHVAKDRGELDQTHCYSSHCNIAMIRLSSVVSYILILLATIRYARASGQPWFEWAAMHFIYLFKSRNKNRAVIPKGYVAKQR